MCCLSCSCALKKIRLVPVLALGFVRVLKYEQHLLFLLLVFLLKGCWYRFMWRRLLWQVWMLFLQFYVLLVLFLRIKKIRLVPVLALGFVRVLKYEQHLLFLLLVFLLKGCWYRFMWRRLLWQVWMLFLQFYVLLVLFLCI